MRYIRFIRTNQLTEVLYLNKELKLTQKEGNYKNNSPSFFIYIK